MNEIKLKFNVIPVLVLLCSLLLTACVTETSGGFNVEASNTDALQDYLQLSMGYLSENDLANARRHLNNAMAIDNNNSNVYGVWGLLYSVEGDIGIADDSFRRALRIDEDNSQVRNNYAAFLFNQARYEDAYEQLAIVVEDTNYVSRAQSFENMGLAALQIDKPEEAEYAFGRALQLSSNQIQSSLGLADLSLQKGTNIQAKAYYDSYLTMIQFYNVPQTARSLWIGIQLEQAIGEELKALEYGSVLASSFPASNEYQRYKLSLDAPSGNE